MRWGIGLYNMFKLIIMTMYSDGYMSFMGNEFGHPDTIIFPNSYNHYDY